MIFSYFYSVGYRDIVHRMCEGKDGEPCDKHATCGPEGGTMSHCTKCKPG